MGKEPRNIFIYECPICESIFQDEMEAEDCHLQEIDETEDWQEGWQCVTCDEIYKDKNKAHNCCD